MKKQQSPAVIVLMVAGIIVAVGFVFFQLNGGSGPAPARVSSATLASALQKQRASKLT